MERAEQGGKAGALHRIPFAVVGIDRELRITEWRGRVERLSGGGDLADPVGRSVVEMLPVVGGAASWRALLADDDDAAPVRLVHDNGQTWEWTPAPVRDGEGSPIGAVCYGREVAAGATGNDSALERVMLRAILDNLPIVAATYAADGEYLSADGRGLATIGVTPDQLVGRNPLLMFSDDTEVVQFARRALAGEPTSGKILEMFGRPWESWYLPAPPGSGAVLVSISLDISDSRARERELLEKIDVIERQKQVIHELSTPIIEVWEGVLALPIIGLVDSRRTAEILDNLLESVVRLRARFAILDLTGVEAVDTSTANHLLGMIRAVRLLGAEGILTGVHPGIAQTIVTLGVELHGITVHAALRQALVYCIARERSGPRRGTPAR